MSGCGWAGGWAGARRREGPAELQAAEAARIKREEEDRKSEEERLRLEIEAEKEKLRLELEAEKEKLRLEVEAEAKAE